MRNVIAMVMAGGMGSRLRPLTEVRAKPAVPFGGIYRIIDFTLSNCVNSEIRQVFVLTQYKSYSLHNHLLEGWNFLPRRLGAFIDEIPAQMQINENWYKGTADAIRQNMNFIREASADRVLILSGDHIYKMDYRQMLEFHEQQNACLTVAVIHVPVEVARGAYGVLEVDSRSRIVGFQEKPDQPVALAGTGQCLASMGIYIFSLGALQRWLDNDHDDFGKHVIPAMIEAGEPVHAFDFTTQSSIAEYVYVQEAEQRVRRLVERAHDSDYWRDVGTLESYWQANLDLVAFTPPLNLYGERWPFFNQPLLFPPAKFVHDVGNRTGKAVNSIISNGVIVSGATVRNSVLGPGAFIHSYAEIERSVLIGGSHKRGIQLETTIGRACKIRNAVIDKNVKLSEGTVIGYDRAADEARGMTTQTILGTDDYVVAIAKNSVL